MYMKDIFNRIIVFKETDNIIWQLPDYFLYSYMLSFVIIIPFTDAYWLILWSNASKEKINRPVDIKQSCIWHFHVFSLIFGNRGPVNRWNVTSEWIKI